MKIRTTIGIVAILPILSAFAGTERVVSDGATFIQGGSFRDEVQGALSTVQIKNSENRSHIRIAMIHFPAIQGDVTDAKLDVVQADASGSSTDVPSWTVTLYGAPTFGDAAYFENQLTWSLTSGAIQWEGGRLDPPWVTLGEQTIQGAGKDGDSLVYSSSELTEFIRRNAATGFVLALVRKEPGDTPSANVVHTFYSDNAEEGLRPRLILTTR